MRNTKNSHGNPSTAFASSRVSSQKNLQELGEYTKEEDAVKAHYDVKLCSLAVRVSPVVRFIRAPHAVLRSLGCKIFMLEVCASLVSNSDLLKYAVADSARGSPSCIPLLGFDDVLVFP